MFNRQARRDEQLQKAIDSVYADLAGNTAESKEYAAAVDQLVKLYSLKEQSAPNRVSPDALVTAGTSLLGILVIVAVEQKHVMASKALGFVRKLT